MFLRHDDRLADARAPCVAGQPVFVDTFDEVLGNEGIKIVETPVRTPVANAFR